MRTYLGWAAALASVALGLPAACPLRAGEFMQAAGAACNGAHLADEQRLTRTVYGISNNSDSGATVVCSVPMIAAQIPPNTQYQVRQVTLSFASHAATRQTVNCTVVVLGDPMMTSPIKGSRTIDPHTQDLVAITIGQDRLSQSTFAATCNLPAHFQLLSIWGQFEEWEIVPMQ